MHSACVYSKFQTALKCWITILLVMSTLIHFRFGGFTNDVAADFISNRRHGGSIFFRSKEHRCQRVDLEICQGIPYTNTIYPNPFLDTDQIDINAQAEHFKPLFRTKCSPHLQFFVCSIFAPMCPEQVPQAITSCRSVCEEVKRDCINIFKEFNMKWPEILECSRFPESPSLCMQPDPAELPLSSTIPSVVPLDDHIALKNFETIPSGQEVLRSSASCPFDLIDVFPENSQGVCAFRCDRATMFRRDRKEQARLWMFMWAALNTFVSAFTIGSFVIERRRFNFPEMSICFVALSSMFASFPFLVRPFAPFEKLACTKVTTSGGHKNSAAILFTSLASVSGSGWRMLAGGSGGGSPGGACMFGFLFQYYFGLAGIFWWLMLTYTWYLSATWKWVEEEINKRAVFLHLFSWTGPAAFAAIAIFAHKVDASELWGLCSLGNLEPWALFTFSIFPKIILTLLGLCLTLSGFTSMCRERVCFKRRGTDTSKLEKFLAKMGLFSFFYIFALVATIGCECYQAIVLSQWYPVTIGCKTYNKIISGGAKSCVRPEQPLIEFFVLKTTMTLVQGLTTAFWAFSPKTLTAWKGLWRLSCFHCCLAKSKEANQRCQVRGGSQAAASDRLLEQSRRNTDQSSWPFADDDLSMPMVDPHQHPISTKLGAQRQTSFGTTMAFGMTSDQSTICAVAPSRPYPNQKSSRHYFPFHNKYRDVSSQNPSRLIVKNPPPTAAPSFASYFTPSNVSQRQIARGAIDVLSSFENANSHRDLLHMPPSMMGSFSTAVKENESK